ncbi:hypothetical protein ACTXT7_014917 [Hymenolepis weldensis]
MKSRKNTLSGARSYRPAYITLYQNPYEDSYAISILYLLYLQMPRLNLPFSDPAVSSLTFLAHIWWACSPPTLAYRLLQ